MTDTKKRGLHAVPGKDSQEYQQRLRRHRIKILRRVIIIATVVLLLLVGSGIYMSLRQYTEYDVRSSVERSDTKATEFATFQKKILKYSNDGAFLTEHNNEVLWNQAYEMSRPKVDMCGDYLTIYDKGGKNIYIFTKAGLVKAIETRLPITQVSIAAQGTIAVLTDNQAMGILTLYDKTGTELVNGAIHGEKGGYPIAIALSDDAIKLAVSILDVSGGSVKTTLAFYNFGTVGENAIDHIVSANTYDDLLIPELDFVSKDCMLAVGDSEILVYEGTQSPKVVTEVALTNETKSVFYNEKYVGIVYNSNNTEAKHQIQVYDLAGKLIMDEASDTEYTRIELLDSDEICLYNRTICDIYTIRGVFKFHHEFEKELYHVISGGSGLNYTFILNGVTEQVRLK